MKSIENFPSNLDQFINELQKFDFYLDPEFNLDKFSVFLGLQTYLTSKLLKEKYDISFSDLKNILRISYSIEKIKEGFLETQTIDALAKKSGFKERVHFSKTFLIFTGSTISQANRKLNGNSYLIFGTI
jgi:AraC-like DNA-binding protein